jgi:hypothetical protein
MKPAKGYNSYHEDQWLEKTKFDEYLKCVLTNYWPPNFSLQAYVTYMESPKTDLCDLGLTK